MTQEQSQQELAENQGDQNVNSEEATSHEKKSDEPKDFEALYKEEKEQREKLEEEKKQSREMELQKKTNPQHIDSIRKRKARQRQQELADTRVPNVHRYSDEELNEMTPAQRIHIQDQKTQQLMNTVVKKIGLVEEGRQEEKQNDQLVDLNKDFPNWLQHQDSMIVLAEENPNLSPRQLLGLAAHQTGDTETVDKLIGRGEKEEKPKVDEEKKVKSAKAGVSQKPSAAATDTVKAPDKKMTPLEAAEKAYADKVESGATE